MNKRDIIRLAFRNFMRRKTRSILTILGVLIGTSAIVVMLSLGIGMNESFRRQLSRMGSLNVIEVNRWYWEEDGMGGGYSRENVLDDKVVAKFEAIEGVEAVMPLFQTTLKLVSGKNMMYANITGIDPKIQEAFDFKVAEGRLLAEDDTTSLLFGSDTPYQFYNPRSRNMRGGYYYIGGYDSERPEPEVDVLNDKMVMTFDFSYGERIPGGGGQTGNRQPKLYKVKGVGILEPSQDEKSYSIFVHIDYLKKIMKENERAQGGRGSSGMDQGYYQVKVKVRDMKDVERVQEEIKNMGYGTYSLLDILKSMQETSATMQAVLGGIGAISLFVAAIGITNTMVMSIYERTREIGVMKVLGCMLSDIRNLFLFEAALIGFIGGLLGIGFSYGASVLLNRYAGGLFGGGYYYGGSDSIVSLIPPWLAVAALAFATLVGIISGFMPARRAMKLSALEAIRTE
ncbi:MAG: ABC transporter permease [Clostridiaceae bacterium]|jgi:putative ABC transport system permease protein|nr:ABC transporter permease [Bacillota bacterium]NLH97337.1 ABC transporter permease [Clostridiaceae bacterium]NLP08545.1 ABC transporter permease [Clostridiaceae bacterium]